MRRLLARREAAVTALLAATVIGTALWNHRFLDLGVLRDLLVNAAPGVVVACGMTLVVVLGEIDISVGSLIGLESVVIGLLASRQHAALPVAAVAAIALALGAGIGLLNGLLVTVGRVPSIIATLGMLVALRGATELLMGGENIAGLPDGLRRIALGAPLGVPVPVLTALATVAAMTLLAAWTPFGRRLYACGSNPHAARLAGLAATRIRLAAFALLGALAAVAALIWVPQQSTIEAGFGKGFELVVVTAVVVGGTAISGGRGSIAGSAIAMLLLCLVRTVLVFLRLGDDAVYWERAIQGGFILAAVLVDRLAARPAETRA